MAWMMLIAAGLLEVVWAFTMKMSEGFTRPVYAVITLVAVIVSFVMLSWAMRSLPLGTAYTIWTGIGAVGSFVVGLWFLGESASPLRIAAALLIVAGLVMMKIAS
ncbi:QacE family quaternary ammonium compound efflux SMR transporter [Pantoea wallisii]|uniref:Guanidinium exporter n=1 Tax=Pantoea wallisii TaxID=1076551 RepID=A0A1X1D6Q6_9GAMM|nr:multidrug efflux SMR transporter [Pantoea wallisii]ORM72317.1 QacE family quaternary ammonium compound efflux SMR transporter [Pantoea wallisii]